jgi:hypothetical protein
MAEPSSDSLAIEGSLLELYEPNAHATPMMVINFLHDLARRSATMPSAMSEDLLNRHRVTANLRLHTEAALIRVACTHADVRIEDNGHGAWLVSGLQPRANTPLCTTTRSARPRPLLQHAPMDTRGTCRATASAAARAANALGWRTRKRRHSSPAPGSSGKGRPTRSIVMIACSRPRRSSTTT